MTLLLANKVSKTYRMGRVDVSVLQGATLSVERGQWVAILGASGSGKSTLLHLCGGLDRPDAKATADGGHVLYEDNSLTQMSARNLDRYRNQRVGFVFQFYHLLPELNVLENVAVPAMVRYGRLGYMRRSRELRAHASDLLDRFGLSDRLRHRPSQLSGGERQRVAIARALMNKPELLLADEPTGNLDRETGNAILDVIASEHAERGQTIVMVTHDPVVARRADHVVHLRDGVVVEENEQQDHA